MDDHLINAVLRAIADKPDVVLVGGNAIVVWVRHYASAPEFAVGDVVTTRDIDFLGTPKRARELAAAVDASLELFATDGRLPELYRQHQVAGSIERVRQMRSRRSPGTMAASNSEVPSRATEDGPES